MTPPMTPREKVRQAILAHVQGVDSSGRVSARLEGVDDACDAILTALASGSGDQIPGPDDVTAPSQMGFLSALGEAAWEQPPHTGSGDHAELEYYGYRAFNAGIGCCHLVANPGPNDTNPEPLVTAASAEALLAENAALRDREKAALKECSDWARQAGEATGKLEASEMAGVVEGWRDRATEAERKLAEAVDEERARGQVIINERDKWIVELIRERDEAKAILQDAVSEAVPDAMIFAGHPDARRYSKALDGLRIWTARARTFLGKEAERG